MSINSKEVHNSAEPLNKQSNDYSGYMKIYFSNETNKWMDLKLGCIFNNGAGIAQSV